MSDRRVSFIHSPELPATYPDIDLVVSCGDLPADYLEYVLTVLNVPLVYVPGNHDPDNLKVPGGMDVDGRLRSVAGVRVLGMGGSIRYKSDGRHQYTQRQMWWRVVSTAMGWGWPAIRGKRGFDLLVAHSPPFGIHDLHDPAHVGFRALLSLMRWARPRLMLHGHVHVRPNLVTVRSRYHDTVVHNVFPHRVIELTQEQLHDA